MKNYHWFKAVVLLSVAICFSACNKEDGLFLDQEKLTKVQEKSNEPQSFVSQEQAIGVANVFFGVQGSASGLRSSVTTQSKASVESLKDQNNDPLMYIVNYPEGGWAIISATRNYYPVLAYSEEGSFEIKIDEDIGPVIIWVEETKQAIKESETLDESTKSEIRSVWNSYATDFESNQAASIFRSSDPLSDAFNKRVSQLVSQLGSMYGYGKHTFYALQNAQSLFSSSSLWMSLCNFANSLGSPPAYTILVSYYDYPSQTVGPLLETHWHQGSPFNGLVPSNYSAGCGAIATAQVLKYYQYPGSFSWNGYAFNWSNIPIDPKSNSDQAALVRLVGNSVNMQYFSFGSWATPGDMENGIRNLGYNVTRSDHNYNTVRTQLLINKKPVIMGGNADNVPLPSPLNYLGNSHYWVCDGAKETGCNIIYFMEFINTSTCTYYSHPNLYTMSNPCTSEQSKYLYFHMNWGWSPDPNTGAYKDGWFLGDGVNSGNGNFQYGRQDFYISKP